MWQVASDKNRRPARSETIVTHHVSPVTRHPQRGVALIVTVILLSVLTLMTLAFLAMSRRERGAVTTTTDTAGARLAADAALANAEAQILAGVLSTTNPYNFGLLVSTNYINPAGFNPAAGANPTNVNYYDSSGNFLTGPDFLQNLANLYYSPRPPVFIQTNGVPDFRFYLDLNRNGNFDANGTVSNVEIVGGVTVTNGTISEVGDPEWIGVLQRPDQPYGPNNPFVARFAFVALPIGNALDLNYIHNQTLNRSLFTTPNSDGFFRNQGVGSWEINLAAFLADLNTNEWDSVLAGGVYLYQQPIGFGNNGAAFADAFVLLTNRYAGNYSTLATVQNLFGPVGATVFLYDDIDGYSDGPLQRTFNTNEFLLADKDNPAWSWAGADNTNHFFTHQELFDPNKTSGGPAGGFTNRLLNAGNGISTYDRYTFYRLLSQLGTDSAPERNKMNLNYRNVANGIVVPNLETNFYSWTAIEFFTNAADRMLRDYSQEWLVSNPSNYVATYSMTTNIGTMLNPTNIPVPFGIANIPVLINSNFVYRPAVQRVLQLAANIYDATTNNTAALGTNFPSVFRPTFWVTNENGYTDVYINGYKQVVSVHFGDQ